jgi:hypothetical protein
MVPFVVKDASLLAICDFKGEIFVARRRKA